MAALVGLPLNQAAYMAEIIRGGLCAVGKKDREHQGAADRLVRETLRCHIPLEVRIGRNGKVEAQAKRDPCHVFKDASRLQPTLERGIQFTHFSVISFGNCWQHGITN